MLLNVLWNSLKRLGLSKILGIPKPSPEIYASTALTAPANTPKFRKQQMKMPQKIILYLLVQHP